MKHAHKIQKVLHLTVNLLMLVLLLCLLALPATSFGIMKIEKDENVLSAQDIRFRVDPKDIIDGKYYYDEETGELKLNPDYAKFKFNSDDQRLDRFNNVKIPYNNINQ